MNCRRLRGLLLTIAAAGCMRSGAPPLAGQWTPVSADGR